MTGAQVLSLNIGRTRDLPVEGGYVTTGIFKSPVEGRVAVHTLGLEGDQQADLTVHGGPNKAVYLYPAEHYAYWKEQLPGMDLPWGMFGENLTAEGLSEDTVRIGDRYQVGSAILQVTQPRMPCYKLGLRFGRADMVRRFWKSGRSGFYFSVVREGELGVRDSIKLLERGAGGVTVAEMMRSYRHK